jgi:hypothetical protein
MEKIERVTKADGHQQPVVPSTQNDVSFVGFFVSTVSAVEEKRR